MSRETASREIHLSEEFVRVLTYYLGEDRHERGGVLLGGRDEGRLNLGCAVFPPQLANARDHCAFDVSGIEFIRGAMKSVDSQNAQETAGTIVGWVHSHPGLGVFLSATDRSTLASWTHLDEQAVAVVVDPFQRYQRNSIKAWGKDDHEIQLRIAEDSLENSLSLLGASALGNALEHASPPSNGYFWDIVTAQGVVRIFP